MAPQGAKPTLYDVGGFQWGDADLLDPAGPSGPFLAIALRVAADQAALLDAAGVACETDIGVGDVAHTLVDMAEQNGVDMVVIGAKGHGALSSALLGSVSQEVAHASPVPVTIVKHAEVLEAVDSDVAEDAEA